MSFDDQIKLMSETLAFAGVHGGGFGNMIFCPEGAHVFEICREGVMSASFYALASAMGHHYWFEKAQIIGRNSRPNFDDITIEPHVIKNILMQIESRLSGIVPHQ